MSKLEDPPEPLLLIPALDQLKVLVPEGRRHTWRLIGRVAWFGLALAVWLAAIASVLGVGWLAQWPGGLTAFVVFASSVPLGAVSVITGARLMAMEGQVAYPVCVSRGSVDVDRRRIPWEQVQSVTSEAGGVALVLHASERVRVADDLPPAAAAWLAHVLVDHQWRAQSRPMDHDALDAIAGVRRRREAP